MAHLYFDESIRDVGRFIIGALVVADRDLSVAVRQAWTDLGLDPQAHEYKSSSTEGRSQSRDEQRRVIQTQLAEARLALVVCPSVRRGMLGENCANLVLQLIHGGFLASERHTLYLDQNIAMHPKHRLALAALGVDVRLEQDSRQVAGIQVSDHAAHALGGMLLETMGLVKKSVRAGDDSGYDPNQLIELGFELWAGLRYALIGEQEEIEGLSVPDDPTSPYFRVEGHGLLIDPNSPVELLDAARKCFGVNYLGCIH